MIWLRHFLLSVALFMAVTVNSHDPMIRSAVIPMARRPRRRSISWNGMDAKERNLADLFRQTYGQRGFDGRDTFSSRKFEELQFYINSEILDSNCHILEAQLYVYKRKRRRYKKQGSALVRVHQIVQYVSGGAIPFSQELRLLDSRLVEITRNGWISFDVTSAILSWVRHPPSNKGLELWIENSEPGRHHTKIAKATKFVRQSGDESRRPYLVIRYIRK